MLSATKYATNPWQWNFLRYCLNECISFRHVHCLDKSDGFTHPALVHRELPRPTGASRTQKHWDNLRGNGAWWNILEGYRASRIGSLFVFAFYWSLIEQENHCVLSTLWYFWTYRQSMHACNNVMAAHLQSGFRRSDAFEK